MSKEFEEKVMEIFKESDKRHAEIMRKFKEENDEKYSEIMRKFKENDERHAEIMRKFEENDKKYAEIMREFKEENDERHNNHDKTLADLKRSILLIEEYVTNKIPALFDAYSHTQDQHGIIDQKIDNLEKVTDTHSLKISVLEDCSKTHSEQLAKLTS